MKNFNRFIRCFLWGLCPECNSDAPVIDNCNVCKGYRRPYDEDESPECIRKAEWWLRYISKDYFRKATKQYLKSLD